MILKNLTFIVFNLSVLVLSTNIVASNSIKSAIDVDLEIKNSEIPIGTLPEFILKIKNISENEIRILNIKERIDLQHQSAHLMVLRKEDKKDVQYIVGRMISDPGNISESNYMTLKKNENIIFILGESTLALTALPPGEYCAYVIYRPDPFRDKSTNYQTEMITFTVGG